MRRSHFGFHFIPHQNRPTAKCRLAQTLAITQYPYLQSQKSLLVAHRFGFRDSAALRRRLEASSWLALRAVAQSARSVQSVAAQSAARRAYSVMLILDELLASATAGGKLQESWRKGKAASRAKPNLRDSFRRRCGRPIQKPNASHPLWWLRASETKGSMQALSASILCSVQRRWLTHRSTGPIAAGRHLGYKSLAQMPARRNGPVSSNVRRRLRQGLQASKTPSSQTTFGLHCGYSWRSNNQALKSIFHCPPPSSALDFVRYQN